MKEFFKQYLTIIANVLCALLFALGFYYLLLNSFHASSIKKVVSVSSNSLNYIEYVNNLDKINDNLKNYHYDKNKYNYSLYTMERIVANLKSCTTYMKSSESILVENKRTLSYTDVYNINEYFIDDLIDKCFTGNLLWIVYDDEKTSFTDEVTIYKSINYTLSNNASYIKQELRDNSSYYYNTAISNSMIRNNLNSSYQLIIRNYYDFSNIILGMSQYVYRGDNND